MMDWALNCGCACACVRKSAARFCCLCAPTTNNLLSLSLSPLPLGHKQQLRMCKKIAQLTKVWN